MSILIATISCVVLRRLTILVCGASGLAEVLLRTAWITGQLTVIRCTFTMGELNGVLALTWLVWVMRLLCVLVL